MALFGKVDSKRQHIWPLQLGTHLSPLWAYATVRLASKVEAENERSEFLSLVYKSTPKNNKITS